MLLFGSQKLNLMPLIWTSKQLLRAFPRNSACFTALCSTGSSFKGETSSISRSSSLPVCHWWRPSQGDLGWGAAHEPASSCVRCGWRVFLASPVQSWSRPWPHACTTSSWDRDNTGRVSKNVERFTVIRAATDITFYYLIYLFFYYNFLVKQ